MGIRLMQDALSPHWAGLSDRARIILIHMAHTALDIPTRNCPEAATFTAGHEALARSYYGRDEITDNEKRIIQKAIKELRDRGAIVVVREPTFRSYPHYKLELGGIPSGPIQPPLDE